MKQLTARVISNIPIMGPCKRQSRPTILESKLMWLACPSLEKPEVGQFVMLRCSGCTLQRPFSIHQVNSDSIAILYSVLEHGRGTLWLAQRQPGDVIDVFEPLGNGFVIHPSSKNLLFVAGGMGIAPLPFLAQEAMKRGCSVTLLYGTSNKDRYPNDLLPHGINIIHVTEDGSVGAKGKTTDLIPDLIDGVDQIFICGPMPMYRDIAQKQLFKGKPAQVSLEARMGCGIGTCYSCTIRTKNGLKQVCKDGPVFELESIVWDELVCAV